MKNLPIPLNITNPTIIKIKTYIACPNIPENIKELITKINIKFLLDIWYLADKNEIVINKAKTNNCGLPSKYSTINFFKSPGFI